MTEPDAPERGRAGPRESGASAREDAVRESGEGGSGAGTDDGSAGATAGEGAAAEGHDPTAAPPGQPATTDAPPGPTPTSDDLGLASLAAASVGLSVSTVTIWGLRGIGVSLGIIAVVLAGVSYWRAGTSSSGRGMAYGSLALGLVTLGVALWVAGRP